MEKLLLVVDDNKEIIDIIQELIGEFFDGVISVGSVDGATQKLEENVFSFIVLDINLEEGRNGAEVLRYIGENPKNLNNDCPVVILSGIINNIFIEKFSKKFAGVVSKPFDHNLFVQMTKDILEKNLKTGLKDIHAVKCDLPFSFPEIEQKVSKVMGQVKNNTRLKQLFNDLQIDRQQDNYLIAHIGMLINISTGIAIKLEWSSDKTLEKFVYAAYLHDMALSGRPDLARINATAFELELMSDKMKPSDYKLILDHPILAADKIDEIPEIPSDVGMMVRQHHELPSENGYPGKISFSKITPLSTVFIVAHDLTDYIIDNPKWVMRDYLVKAKARFKGPHFARVINALSDLA